MNESTIAKQRKTELLKKNEQDAKHRWHVLEEWLKTQYTYKEDIQAALTIVKPKIEQQKLIDKSISHKLFPQFEQMLQLSQSMIQIISQYKVTPINQLMIGKKLNSIVSYYKIYLEYFKNKSEIKKIFQQMEKNNQKQLKSIQKELQDYFEKFYQKKLAQDGKDKGQLKNPKANISIHDCLQRPLYRLFKYHLLIDSYIKKLPKSHPDYPELRRTLQLFSQIGQKCNNSITQQQKQELKYKLQQLYGQTLPQTSQYKTIMSADTLYFPCKLYIFSNLIIISKAQKLIGFRQQKLYMKLGIDQFSFITYKKNVKYFKNILLLCGIYQCIHLFLPEKGTRLQIYQLISKIIHQQKLKAFQKRQHKQIKATNKLTFLIDQKQKSYRRWLTGMRVEVVDIDMRNMGLITNDTAFILSISIPEYIDDQATFLKASRNSLTSQESPNTIKNQLQYSKNEMLTMTREQKIMVSRIGPVPFKKFQTSSDILGNNKYCALNQHLEIHLKQLISINKKLQQQFPQINFPQIDPLTKDFNFYTQSKKKTKSFQIRAFLIEQFFNFIFRHPDIMGYPLKILHQLRVDQNIWNYVAERSLYLENQKREQKSQQSPGNKYDQDHCQECKSSTISNISQFQFLRLKKIKLSQSKPENYCFNFYNLLRNNLLGLAHQQFNTLQRMLYYVHYFQGRLDYNFMFKKNLSKKCKVIKIFIPKLIQPSKRQDSQTNNIFQTACQISIDHKTTIGMIVNSIAKDIQILNMLDYRLIIQFNNQKRILDQDQYVHDLIDKYELDYQQKTLTQNDSQMVGLRNSIREESFANKTIGFFSMIKNVLPSINKSKSFICLRKVVYFPLHLELLSIQSNYQRSRLMVIEILQKISKMNISLSLETWGQLCGLYHSILISNEVVRVSLGKQSNRSCIDILPPQKYDLIKNKIFTDRMQNTIQGNGQMKKYANNLTKNEYLMKIHQKIIEIAYQNFKVNTYFAPVVAKMIPSKILMEKQVQEGDQCFIGVNFNQIIVVKDQKKPVEVIRIPLEDVEIVHSVYSLFLTFKRQIFEEDKEPSMEQFQLRFDNKMLHGFVQLCQKYKILKSKFGSLFVDPQL